MTSALHAEALKLLDKAADTLENAAYNLKGDFTLATANRAYYSCFYCMTALLHIKNIHPKTHQGVRAKFSELYIKNTALFPVETLDTIKNLFDYRQEADYDFDADISIEEAEILVKKAKKFL